MIKGRMGRMAPTTTLTVEPEGQGFAPHTSGRDETARHATGDGPLHERSGPQAGRRVPGKPETGPRSLLGDFPDSISIFGVTIDGRFEICQDVTSWGDDLQITYWRKTR